MTDSLLVLRKLAVLRDHLARVERRRPTTADQFSADLEVQDALSMSLHVAIQESIDIALHITADEGWGVVARYADGFDLLARHAVIDTELARVLGTTVALRNRIAHGDASLDPQRLWNELPVGMQALRQYAEVIATYLEKVVPPGKPSRERPQLHSIGIIRDETCHLSRAMSSRAMRRDAPRSRFVPS